MASVQRLHAAAKMRIGDLLVSEGLITPEQLTAALGRQASSGRRLGRVLVDMGYVSERDVAMAIGEQLGIRFVDVQLDRIDPDLCRKLPEVQARRLRAVPLFDNGKTMIVGVADPTELTLVDELERILRRPVEFVLVEESKIIAAIEPGLSRCRQDLGAGPGAVPGIVAGAHRHRSRTAGGPERQRRRCPGGAAAAFDAGGRGADARLRHPHRTSGKASGDPRGGSMDNCTRRPRPRPGSGRRCCCD
jgi:hypothetical protein